ncbi:nucleoside diphosphate kinase [Desulfobotulus alkaliphilus]|uniref:Nucleoside diphosphate kinase n=1 Tax=Desulfobotulus alkaliphilus TaxID=622671 RepID=A0A562SA89_9BACT|nr:nucleoside-diphosphate kinase [Desulfobotulus alkaliphilus]TWI77466.1 nucleoside diphosphate kinase [Desulfobotulus alkaliphilus]
MEQTLALIKPDAVSQGSMGAIIQRMERENFRISAMKMLQLSQKEAAAFYHVHREKGFFDSLVDFMTSGPLVALVLERENAIAHWRSVMGATDYRKAEEGTIRKEFATALERNAVHGSDAEETAKEEIAFFFCKRERT